jgi:hypothetical protein
MATSSKAKALATLGFRALSTSARSVNHGGVGTSARLVSDFGVRGGECGDESFRQLDARARV